MKFALASIGGNIVTLACVIIAAHLIVHDKDGWGWFLFVALCCAVTINSKDTK